MPNSLQLRFIKSLTEKLLLWTGERWIISLSKNSNAKSVYENGWTTSNPKALRGDGNFSYFSAVCYTFGRNLYKKYRNDTRCYVQ